MTVVGAPSLIGPSHTAEGRPNDLYDPGARRARRVAATVAVHPRRPIYGGSNEVAQHYRRAGARPPWSTVCRDSGIG